MNIAVIAANGRLGQAFVQEALIKGHTIRAGVHHTNNFSNTSRLTVVPCDATKTQDVEALIGSQDAVVTCIGHTATSAPDVQTKAASILIQAMHKEHIGRIVSITGTGVRFPGDKIPLIDYLLNTGLRFVDSARIHDGIEHMKLLEASNLEWTLIRVLKLQNIAAKPFTLDLHGPTKWVVGRQEVARAILEVLENHSFIRQAPILSNT